MLLLRYSYFRLFIIMFCMLIGHLPSQMQSEPVTVSLRPVEPIVPQIGNRFVMEIVVNSTEPLYGGDVTSSYNPDNLQVVDKPAQGTYFALGGPQFVQEPDNVAGSVQYAYSQQGQVDHVKGEGVFTTVEFEIISTGTIRIAFRAVKFTTLELNSEGGVTGAISQPVFKQEFVFDKDVTPDVGGTVTPVPNITTPSTVTPVTQPQTGTTVTVGVTPSVEVTVEMSEPLTFLTPPPDPPDPTEGLPIIPILTFVIAGAFVVLILFGLYTMIAKRKPAHAQLAHYGQGDNYSGSKQIKLYENRSYIGREKARQVNVLITSQAVSAVHALIVCKNLKDYYIADLNSTNGTFVFDPFNDTYSALPSNTAYQLTPGTIIRFGKDLHFTFEPLPKESINQTLHQDSVMQFEDRLIPTDTLIQ